MKIILALTFVAVAAALPHSVQRRTLGFGSSASHALSESASHGGHIGVLGIDLINIGTSETHNKAESAATSHTVQRRSLGFGGSSAASHAQSESASHGGHIGLLGIDLINIGTSETHNKAESAASSHTVQRRGLGLGGSSASSHAQAESASHGGHIGVLGIDLINLGTSHSNAQAESAASSGGGVGGGAAGSSAAAAADSHTIGGGVLGGLFSAGLTSSHAQAASESHSHTV